MLLLTTVCRLYHSIYSIVNIKISQGFPEKRPVIYYLCLYLCFYLCLLHFRLCLSISSLFLSQSYFKGFGLHNRVVGASKYIDHSIYIIINIKYLSKIHSGPYTLNPTFLIKLLFYSWEFSSQEGSSGSQPSRFGRDSTIGNYT